MTRLSWFVPSLLVVALAVPIVAQDGGGSEPPPPQDAPRRSLRDLRFGPVPEGWQAIEQEAQRRRRFLAEYQLPAAAGQAEGPKVSVLALGARQAQSFEEYKARLVAGWTKADGSAVTEADQTLTTRREGDVVIKVIEQSGTFSPARGGEARSGIKLVAVWVQQGQSRWSVWLQGTLEAVDAQKAAYLTWVDTAQPGDPLPQGSGNNSGGGGGEGGSGGDGPPPPPPQGGSGPF